MLTDVANAYRDIADGLLSSRLCFRLSWTEIRRRYKRTILGPFWATMSMAIFIGALGFLWAQLWDQPAAQYIPYLTTGFLAWVLITSIMQESCLSLVTVAPIILQLKFPYTGHILCVVYRCLIVFFHHLIVYVVVFFLFIQTFHAAQFLFIPGVILVLANCAWMALVLSIVCTRYRDVPTLVMSAIQIMMFITPIMWPADLLDGRKAVLVTLNPMYHLIELIRAPMLGQYADALSWIVCLAMMAIGWLSAFVLLARYRKWIPYWL